VRSFLDPRQNIGERLHKLFDCVGGFADFPSLGRIPLDGEVFAKTPSVVRGFVQIRS
jgi:hypothetical protein